MINTITYSLLMDNESNLLMKW